MQTFFGLGKTHTSYETQDTNINTNTSVIVEKMNMSLYISYVNGYILYTWKSTQIDTHIQTNS